MKPSVDWLEVIAFFAVSFLVFLVISVAFMLALPSRFIYVAARPLQAWLVRLSAPKQVRRA